MIFYAKDLIVVKKQLRLNQDSGWYEITTPQTLESTAYDLFPEDMLRFSYFYVLEHDPKNPGVGLNFDYVDSTKTDGPEFLIAEFEKFLLDGTFVIISEE